MSSDYANGEARESKKGDFYRTFEVAILSCMLLAVAIGQRLGFKVAGYGLGDKPFLMILLSVMGSVPLNMVLYAYMLKRTGGVLPEYRTLRYFRDYWIIATLNVGNGLAIMWANPYVSGYIQALMSNAAIPITMVLSVICFGTKFSIAALLGVLMILLGLFAVSDSPADGSTSSLVWTAVFIIAQLPLSAACVYQEHAFRESLNMVHYIHYVTLFLLGDLILAVPLDVMYGDAKSFSGFVDNIVVGAQCIANSGPPGCDGVGLALFCYVFCMNAGNLFQALLIKRVDATWYMVVLSVSTPLAAISFACPQLVGEMHTESLDLGAVVATVLVGVGTIIYRLGSLPAEVDDDDTTKEGYQLLGDEPCSPKPFVHVGVQTDIAIGPQAHDAKMLLNAFLKSENNSRNKTPGVVAAGIGLFASEYTNATKNPLSIFDERTFRELELAGNHSARARSTSPHVSHTKRVRTVSS